MIFGRLGVAFQVPGVLRSFAEVCIGVERGRHVCLVLQGESGVLRKEIRHGMDTFHRSLLLTSLALVLL